MPWPLDPSKCAVLLNKNMPGKKASLYCSLSIFFHSRSRCATFFSTSRFSPLQDPKRHSKGHSYKGFLSKKYGFNSAYVVAFYFWHKELFVRDICNTFLFYLDRIHFLKQSFFSTFIEVWSLADVREVGARMSDEQEDPRSFTFLSEDC